MLCSCLEQCFSPTSSLVTRNPVTAAVHTMGNPKMTQLCVDIKTHVGHEEELKGTVVVFSV